jgi:peptide/nickel transport system permease protein
MGRDIFSQLLYAAINDLRFGIVCVGIAGVVAMVWALLAANMKKTDNWIGDTLEDVVMLPRDIACAFPWSLLILLPMSILERDNATLIVVSGMVLLPHLAGMMKEAYTSPPEDVDWLPSVLWSIPVMLLYATAGAIIYVSAVSYLGFGVSPGTPELSAMLSQEGRKYMELAPHLSVWPGTVLTLLIFVWVLAGNTLLEYLGFKSRSLWLKVFE